MEGLKLIPYLALVLAIAGIVIGASVVTLGKFGENVDQKCWNNTFSYNTSDSVCYNNTLVTSTYHGKSGSNLSTQMFTVLQGLEGESSIAEQLPTVAIIGIMVVIISIIAGVFVYMKYFG